MDYKRITERKLCRRLQNLLTAKADFKKALRELLEDDQTVELLCEYGRQFRDYEKLMSFLVGTAMAMIHYSTENIQRLQQIEPKSAELVLELQTIINQTVSQINSLIRSLSNAYKQDVFMSLIVSDFLSHQLQAIHKSGLSEEAKRDIVYELIKNAKEYSLQDAQKRKSIIENVVLDLFGIKPEDFLLQAQPTKTMTKEEVLSLLKEVYGA